MLFLYAENDSPGRGAINRSIAAELRDSGNSMIQIREIPGSDHGTIIHSDGIVNKHLSRHILDFVQLSR